MKRFAVAVIAAAVLAGTPAWADLNSAIRAVKAQPRAVDVKADKSGNLYVLVKPEKVSWSQYASVMCAVVKPHQARIFRVRVVELTKANYSKPEASWDRVGEASCSD